jgi:ATP-dependent DNA ligase
MLARLSHELPAEDHLYEPKWDGFRALAFRDGAWAELQSRHLNRFGRYFPELLAALRGLAAERLVLDGEIIVFGESGADFGALLKRIHPADSRVQLLSRQTPASFVAFDVVAEGDADLMAEPFEERRRRLERILRDAGPPLLLTPITDDLSLAQRWLEEFTGVGVDGVVAKPRSLRYEPDRRVMVKVKRERTAECVVAGFRSVGDEVTSLLLALYAGDGSLRHVGVSSSFTREKRRELKRRLDPLGTPLERHPWKDGFGIERRPVGRLRGAAGVWLPGMAMDWTAVRPVLVCEVRYDQLDGDRFRHPARFVRWRPDRTPESCGFDQLTAARPAA